MGGELRTVCRFLLVDRPRTPDERCSRSFGGREHDSFGHRGDCARPHLHTTAHESPSDHRHYNGVLRHLFFRNLCSRLRGICSHGVQAAGTASVAPPGSRDGDGICCQRPSDGDHSPRGILHRYSCN